MQKVHKSAEWNRMKANHVIIIYPSNADKMESWQSFLFHITIFFSIMHTNQAHINFEFVSVQWNIRQRKSVQVRFYSICNFIHAKHNGKVKLNICLFRCELWRTVSIEH